MGEHVYRGQGGQRHGHQGLHAVRKDSLGEARHGVEDACTAAGIDAITLADVLCNRTHRDECHRVVRSAEVHKKHHQGDTHLAATPAVDLFRQRFQDRKDEVCLRRFHNR